MIETSSTPPMQLYKRMVNTQKLCTYTDIFYIYIFNYKPNIKLSCSRPLHVAARNGLTVVVQELLAKGASVLAVDENGKC